MGEVFLDPIFVPQHFQNLDGVEWVKLKIWFVIIIATRTMMS